MLRVGNLSLDVLYDTLCLLADGVADFVGKEKSEVDKEDNQELADWNDGELDRDFYGFHTKLFDLNKSITEEFVGERWIVVVVDQEVHKDV